ncbi:MAG: sodium export ATP-binding protein [Bacillales bacterium]|jgi:ABC-2 type transport system ATP-binding protein|nr:sodium export ATP-binding protein [Bacillales bacterium]
MLELNNISKKFYENIAVNDVSLKVNKGEVLGLLGRNGAGKTTTIKMILNLLKTDKGEILWNGKLINTNRPKIGYLPEERGLYGKTTVANQLRYFAELEGISTKEANRSIDLWLERLDIPEYKNKKAEELSKGNQQKIQLIAALIHNPELIILDEPFSGLDPVNTSTLSEVIEEQIVQGKTVILSSHRMETIESFCKKICLLNKGEVILYGDLDNIKDSYGYRNLILKENYEVISILNKSNVVYSLSQGEISIKVKNDSEAFTVLNLLKDNNVSLQQFKFIPPTLHDIFVERVS